MGDLTVPAFLRIRRYSQRFSLGKVSTLRQIGIVAVFVFLASASIGILRAGQEASSSQSAGAAAHGVELTILDKTCKPCEDFFHYASGDWLAKNPVPAAYPSWGRFNELAERNRELLHQILEGAAANTKASAGSNEQKIGDFYASCMDEKQTNAAGAKPLETELASISAIQSMAELQAEVARLQALGVAALFEFGSTQDDKNSSQVIGGADQGGLGLPDRDYYTKTDDKSKEIRRQYEGHVAKMLALAGDDDARATSEAKDIMDLETRLAEASMNRVDRRDPDKTYHKMSRSELQTLMPNWSWENYFQQIGYTNIDFVDVSAPKFFEAASQQIKETPLDTWKIYLRWHLLNSTAAYLSQPFVDENFNFNGRVLQGTKELLPRWKRCVTATDHQL